MCQSPSLEVVSLLALYLQGVNIIVISFFALVRLAIAAKNGSECTRSNAREVVRTVVIPLSPSRDDVSGSLTTFVDFPVDVDGSQLFYPLKTPEQIVVKHLLESVFGVRRPLSLNQRT